MSEDAVTRESQRGRQSRWRRSWRRSWRRLPRFVRILVIAGFTSAALTAVPFGWTEVAAAGHLYTEAAVASGDGPRADVVLVLGAQVAPGGTRPMPVLRGRLDTAAALMRGGHAKVILVSGDAAGGSGDETTVMSAYLTRDHGIDPARVVVDPYGLDTYDSCLRARQVYGVTRALVVTQRYHLARAVALCRHVGIDADGVGARCDGCVGLTLVRNAVRDYLACTKAGLDAAGNRTPAVASPPSTAVTDALARM